jgi:transcriptional regulator with XRE-family HTH domain
VRKLRYNRGWSQAKLAIQLQLKGLDVAREVVAQIEGQTHCVRDRDLPYFMRVFQVDMPALFPTFAVDRPIHDSIMLLLGNGKPEAPLKVVMKSLQPDPANLINQS